MTLVAERCLDDHEREPGGANRLGEPLEVLRARAKPARVEVRSNDAEIGGALVLRDAHNKDAPYWAAWMSCAPHAFTHCSSRPSLMLRFCQPSGTSSWKNGPS